MESFVFGQAPTAVEQAPITAVGQAPTTTKRTAPKVTKLSYVTGDAVSVKAFADALNTIHSTGKVKPGSGRLGGEGNANHIAAAIGLQDYGDTRIILAFLNEVRYREVGSDSFEMAANDGKFTIGDQIPYGLFRAVSLADGTPIAGATNLRPVQVKLSGGFFQALAANIQAGGTASLPLNGYLRRVRNLANENFFVQAVDE